jgi:transketolase
VIARTIKGAGIPEAADKDGWHGKALAREEAEKAVAALSPKAMSASGVDIPKPNRLPEPAREAAKKHPPLKYKKGESIATRQACGNALERLGEADSRLVALDGDVKNSTHSELFAKRFPGRFIECFIAEQNMIGVATGLAAQGWIPFASTFGAFLSRAHDQIRMAGHSRSNLKLVGSHVGVSIGEDGGSQMALEDIAMMRAVPGSIVLYPCDAVSTEKLTRQMVRHQGIAYLRVSRPKTGVLYDNGESFRIGGAKILRQERGDNVTVVTAGITVFEALAAADRLVGESIGLTVIDAYSVKPLAREVILDAARATNNVVLTVEDHYPEGGLGDAVAGELASEGVRVHKLAVFEVPRSGKPAELLAHYKLDAAAIVAKVKQLLQAPKGVSSYD